MYNKLQLIFQLLIKQYAVSYGLFLLLLYLQYVINYVFLLYFITLFNQPYNLYLSPFNYFLLTVSYILFPSSYSTTILRILCYIFYPLSLLPYTYYVISVVLLASSTITLRILYHIFYPPSLPTITLHILYHIFYPSSPSYHHFLLIVSYFLSWYNQYIKLPRSINIIYFLFYE